MKYLMLSVAFLFFSGCSTTSSDTSRGMFVNKDLAYAIVLSADEKAIFDTINETSKEPIPLESDIVHRPPDELRSPLSYPYEYYISSGKGEPFHLYCLISDPPFFYGVVKFRDSSSTDNRYSNDILRLTERYVAQTSAVKIDDLVAGKLAYLINIKWKSATVIPSKRLECRGPSVHTNQVHPELPTPKP